MAKKIKKNKKTPGEKIKPYTRSSNLKAKKKNRSSKIKPGTILQTRDNYLESGKNYKGKKGYSKSELYRPFLVIETNSKDEVAGQKITHGKYAVELPEELKPSWIEGISVFIETKDKKGNPIKEGPYFKRSKKKATKRQVEFAREIAFLEVSKSLKKENQRKLNNLKKRK